VALGAPVIELALELDSVLAESPVWSEGERSLYWVDIKRRLIHRFEPRTRAHRTWSVPEDIGSLALRERGGAVLAMRSGFALFDFETGAVRALANPIAGRDGLRFNDGRADPGGRFWAATVSERREPGTAALYRLDPDGTCSEVAGGLTIGNGIAWSPDARTMYYADSWTRTVYAQDFDATNGTTRNRRVLTVFPEGAGVPDGATVDAEGFLWYAHYDGWRIARYAPDGRLAREIMLPVQRPTSCEFGGPGLRALYVTTANNGLSAQELAQGPLAGSLFALDVGVHGIAEPRFHG
jgi:L-arabinonolactonase